MSFPHHDPAWGAAGNFVRAHRSPDESILAPDAFVWWFDRIHRYDNTRIRPGMHYDWAIVHNWMLHHLDAAFLEGLDREMRPVHADNTFVVWRRAGDLPRLGRFNAGVARFRRNRRDYLRRNGRYAPGAEYAGPEPGMPEDGTIFRFNSVPRYQLKGIYESFYARGGYHFTTPRDQVNTNELNRRLREFLGDTAGLHILDIGCGTGRLAGLVHPSAAVVGVDLAETPLHQCRARFPNRANLRLCAMKGEALAFPDASFDLVAMIDVSEHVYDFDVALAEAARVTRPGGRFLITAQNTDSLHRIVNRKLGYPEFLTNNQHFREFSFPEMTSLLAAQGLTVDQSAGIVLYPYWEIPGIDEHARRIVDDDGDFAELMRVLGGRAGPEYAYTFIIGARKGA